MSLSKYDFHYIEWLLNNITRKSSALNWSYLEENSNRGKIRIPQALAASILIKLTLVEQYSTGKHFVPLSSPRVYKYGIYK